MVILHIHNKSSPPSADSGGSNRLIEWLAAEQAKHGHTVYVMSPAGSSTESYKHIEVTDSSTYEELLNKLPDDVDSIEYHGGLNKEAVDRLMELYPRSIRVIHAGQSSDDKSVFVSSSHAKQSDKSVFAYNGVPSSDYIYSEIKDDYLLFLAKVKRSKKGIDTAVRIAKKSKTRLIVAGGSRLATPETWFPWHPLIKPVGYINGHEKYRLLSKAKALIVPIKWDEPFGLTIIEAMLSGTPVIAFNRGAMSELIVHGVTGYICNNEDEMLDAIKNISKISPENCRDHAEKHFSTEAMYLRHNELLEAAERGESW
jgi:glycosyltransferase involved in cell wall biosynthesis